jgi:hypothetical protein
MERMPPTMGPPAKEGRDPEGKLSKDEMMDTKIAYEMMRGLFLNPKGQGVLLDALSKPNPAPATSIIVASMVDKIAKKMEQKGLGLSPRAWLAEGGAVDKTLDEMANIASKNKIAFDERLQSQVFAGVVDQLKLAAQADENEEMESGMEQQQQQEMGPPPPMGGPQQMAPPPPGPMMGPPPPTEQGGF